MSGPFPIICPIEKRDVGGDGVGCLVGRHYEKMKVVSYWSFYKVDRLRYCRSIVLDNLSARLVKTKALPW